MHIPSWKKRPREGQLVNSKGRFDNNMKGGIICTPVIIYNAFFCAPLHQVSREKGRMTRSPIAFNTWVTV